MKQLKSRAMLLSLVVIIFATSTTNIFAQLTKIWDRSNENFKLERLCAPGKLAVVSKNGNYQLIDLTNGETIYSSTNGITTNYWGDRFYVHESGNLNEYDVKTKEFIKVVIGIPVNSDSSMLGFNYTHHSLLIRNGNTRELLDSFKIPNTPDEPTYSTYNPSFVTSNDARLIVLHMQANFNPTAMHFLLYDRQDREIIMQEDLPVNSKLIFSFFNTSNHFAYVEKIQLPEDDKAYSYIRIYDPEKRMVIKNLKLFDDDVHYPSFITFRQDDQIFAYGNGTNNDIHFFDFENDRKIEFTIPTFPGPLYLDDSLYIAGSYRGYKFDWNVVSVAEEHEPEIPTLYPNPTTSMINLNVADNLYNGQWQISDLTGSILLQGLILPNPQLQINLSPLPAQTYFLRLQKGNKLLTYKIQKI